MKEHCGDVYPRRELCEKVKGERAVRRSECGKVDRDRVWQV